MDKTAGDKPGKAAQPASPADVEPTAQGTGQAPEKASGFPKQSAEALVSDEDLEKPIEFPFSRMPDDPGTTDEDEEEKPPRPKFFN